MSDQYGAYIVVDDIKINSELTLGEDVADLGGEILAYAAWKEVQGPKLEDRDGLTPTSASSSASRSGRARTRVPSSSANGC